MSSLKKGGNDILCGMIDLPLDYSFVYCYWC